MASDIGKQRDSLFSVVSLVALTVVIVFPDQGVLIYRLMSVRGRENLKCRPKIVPRAKRRKKSCKQTPEDVLRSMASLGSG